MWQMFEEIFTLRLVQSAYEPQVQLLQTVQRLVDDATLAEASRANEIEHVAALLSVNHAVMIPPLTTMTTQKERKKSEKKISRKKTHIQDSTLEDEKKKLI